MPILYLSLNRLGPPQQGLELGVGDGVLLKAVAQATGKQGVWWQLLREETLREKVQRWRGCERWQRGTEGGSMGAGSGEGGPVPWVGGGAGEIGVQKEQVQGAGTECPGPERPKSLEGKARCGETTSGASGAWCSWWEAGWVLGWV